MRKPLVAGNWKMYGSTAFVEDLIEALKSRLRSMDRVETAVCPPFPYLSLASRCLDRSAIALGAQNVCDRDEGAYTGEVSGKMLAECGCRYAIVGHSERRHLYGESDALVAARFQAAKRHGLCPILCLGEMLDEREAGKTEEIVSRQLDAVIEAGGIESLAGTVIAYEPVWAIGTGKNATPGQAQAVHAYIRARIAQSDPDIAGALRILYGGSVKPDNAGELFSQADIDGGLIGGASLKVESFAAIVEAAG